MIGFSFFLSPSVLACLMPASNEETFWLFGDARRQSTLNASSIESSGGSQSAGELSKNKWDTFVTSHMWRRRRSPLTCKRAIISCCFKCYVLFRPLAERERERKNEEQTAEPAPKWRDRKELHLTSAPHARFFFLFSFWNCCKKIKNKNKNHDDESFPPRKTKKKKKKKKKEKFHWRNKKVGPQI